MAGDEKLRKTGNLEGGAFPNALVELHKKHTGALLEHLSALGYSTDGDSPEAFVAKSIGMPGKISLARLTDGENALFEAYNDA